MHCSVYLTNDVFKFIHIGKCVNGTEKKRAYNLKSVPEGI